MLKFRIGQKVQMVIPSLLPPGWNINQEDRAAAGSIGFITGRPFPEPRCPPYVRYPTDIGKGSGTLLCVVEFALVPVYDGDAPSSWAESAWRPNIKKVKKDLIPA